MKITIDDLNRFLKIDPASLEAEGHLQDGDILLYNPTKGFQRQNFATLVAAIASEEALTLAVYRGIPNYIPTGTTETCLANRQWIIKGPLVIEPGGLFANNGTLIIL